MPAQRQKHTKSTQSHVVDSNYFICDRCGHKGKAAKGGLEKHLKMSQRCRGLLPNNPKTRVNKTNMQHKDVSDDDTFPTEETFQDTIEMVEDAMSFMEDEQNSSEY
jgi:hypothetical protein